MYFLETPSNAPEKKSAKRIRAPRPDSGIAYVGVLLILLIVLAMGLAFLMQAATEAAATQSMANGLRAEYLAEAAHNHAVWRLLYDGTIPTYAEAAAADQFNMVNFQGYRYGYNFRPPTATTYGTVRTIGAAGTTIVTQGWVLNTTSFPFRGILCAYGNNTNLVQSRSFLDPAFGDAADSFDVSTKTRWVMAAGSPIEREIVVATVDDDNDINAAVFDGSAWGNPIEFATAADDTTSCAAIAYESLAGDALLMGRRDTTNDLYYRVWNGTSWGATTTLSNAYGTGPIRQVALASHPTTDKMIAIFLTNNSVIGAYEWNGSSWPIGAQIAANASTTSYMPCAVGYEKLSGDAVLLHCNSSNQLIYNHYNGVSLISGTVITTGNRGRFVKQASHVETNSIMAAMVDADFDMSVAVWKSTAWAYATEIETSMESNTSAAFAVAWEDLGDEAIVFFGRNAQDTLSYRRWNNNTNTMGSLQTGPDFGADIETIQTLTIPGEDRIIVLVGTENSKLQYTLWNGNGFDVSPPTTLDTALFDVMRQPFMPVATQ